MSERTSEASVKKGQALAQRAHVADRDHKAWLMRVEGHLLKDIAEQCGYPNVQGAHAAVNRVSERMQQPPDEFMQLLADRAEYLWREAHDVIENAKLRDASTMQRTSAVQTALNVIEGTSRLLGLARKTTVNVNITGADLAADVDKLLARQRASAAQVIDVPALTQSFDDGKHEKPPAADS